MSATCFRLLMLAAVAVTAASAPALPAFAAEQEIVKFRLGDWRTLEFEDAGQAQARFETFKKLGCDVKQQAHEGHVDVSYRCPEWRQIAVKSHSLAHKWEKWLKAGGFETKHTH